MKRKVNVMFWYGTISQILERIDRIRRQKPLLEFLISHKIHGEKLAFAIAVVILGALLTRFADDALSDRPTASSIWEN